jgi:pSer/pThr/pTyr-binding forkhead associated (FHA) protein
MYYRGRIRAGLVSFRPAVRHRPAFRPPERFAVSSASVSIPSPGGRAAATLSLRIAGRSGPTFVLDPARENTLGRAAEASIVIADRLASRNHASIHFDVPSDAWMLRDLGSRNGTFLDGMPVTAATLPDGGVIRLGTSELVFRKAAACTAAPPADAPRFVRHGPVTELEGSVLRRSSSGATDDARRPLLLYQTSIRLLSSRSRRDVIEAALELAIQHAGAASVGWFRVQDGARLEPVCIVPPGGPLATLVGEAEAGLVARESHAVWLAAGDSAHEIACVPIMDESRVHAALVASAAAGAIRSTDFDFLVALARLASAAWDGHARQPAGNDDATDLASLPTVGLDSISGFALAAGGPETDDLPPDAPTAIDATVLQRFAIPADDASPSAARIGAFVAETSSLRLDDWQRILVIEALRRTGGSVPNAAAELGISRATLSRKLASYGLTR